MLRVVGEARAAAYGAYCLDGSRPGLWYSEPATVPTSGNRSWLVLADGGAWCYSLEECEGRSLAFRGGSGYGSSGKKWPSKFWPYGGPLSADPAVNPAFAGYHRVLLGYCDGSSYTGDLEQPLIGPRGRKVFFRGRRVLEALVLELLDMGMQQAERVLWSGGSAGGVGVLHAANRVRAQLPVVAKFKVLVMNGFFLSPPPPEAREEPTCAQGRGAAALCVPWVIKMRNMCELHNCSSSLLTTSCGAAAASPADQWRCLFPGASLGAVAAPTFVINSALDAWQMVNVWRRFYRCRWDNTRGCTLADRHHAVRQTNRMIRAFVLDLKASGAISRPGNGAFVHTCNEHIAAFTNGYQRYRIGEDELRHALAKWWNAADDAPASVHSWLPCHFVANSSRSAPHHQCNPTCKLVPSKRRMMQECPCSPSARGD